MAVSDSLLDRIPFSQSLAGRLVVFGVLPAAGLMAGVLAWGAADKFDDLERMAENELLRHALFTAAQVEESNIRAMDTARLLAVQQEAGLFGQRALTVDLLKRTLESSPDLAAAYVAYEPNADGNDSASLASDPKEWLDAAGRFIPYPFRDWTKGDRIAVKALVDYEAGLYYDGVRRAFAETGKAATLVTEPYLYDGQLVVEQSHPIVIGGRFRGIGATDRTLASLEAIVRARAEESGAIAYLVSSRGRFIVATTDPEGTAGPAAASDVALRTRPIRAMGRAFSRRACASRTAVGRSSSRSRGNWSSRRSARNCCAMA
jgi:methyl-accepting chemotaxis protein